MTCIWWRNVGAGAGHEEAGDREYANFTDDAGGAGPAMFIEGIVGPDLPAIRFRVQHRDVNTARPAPHSLSTDSGYLTDCA